MLARLSSPSSFFTARSGSTRSERIDEPEIDRLSVQIKSGSISFLQPEYSFLAVFVLIVASTLFVHLAGCGSCSDDNTGATVIGIALGATCSCVGVSASAGWWGMMVARVAGDNVGDKVGDVAGLGAWPAYVGSCTTRHVLDQRAICRRQCRA